MRIPYRSKESIQIDWSLYLGSIDNETFGAITSHKGDKI